MNCESSIGHIVAVQPMIKKMLRMLLPNTFPNAMPTFPLRAALTDTASSGNGNTDDGFGKSECQCYLCRCIHKQVAATYQAGQSSGNVQQNLAHAHCGSLFAFAFVVIIGY